jgi:aldehyde:ferredoxin oxidoreductase
MTHEVLRKLGEERYSDPEFFTDIPWVYRPKYARRVVDVENRFALADMTGTCKFVAREVLLVKGIGIDDFAELLTYATGVEFRREDLVAASEREMLLERAFNAREGIRRIDDYPFAFQWEQVHGGAHPRFPRETYKMSLDDYHQLLEEYYRLRRCSLSTGIPTEAALASLGLEDVARDLRARHLSESGS